MNIKQQIVPVENRPKINGSREEYAPSMTPEYITIHETDNTSVGANAQAHANLQSNGNSRVASWHVQVDEKEAIQSIPFNQSALAAGDGENGPGNRTSIHIEICMNSDGDFEKAVQNAASVTAQLMKQFNIPSEKIVPHKHWSGKNCPSNLLQRWQEFINLCISKRDKLEVNAVSAKSAKSVKSVGKEVGTLALKAGDRGEGVQVLNHQLASLGYIQWKDREYDAFGDTTLNALKKFQKDQHLKETGVYDYATARQFAKVLAVYYQRLKENKLI